jgi:transcriptional regulator with XRE-family HTH domain
MIVAVAAVGGESVSEDEEWDPRLRQLGEYIRMQRQLADLSLRRLAEMTSVSNAYLSQIERGLHQPSLRVIRSIADALNVSADVLLAQAGLVESRTAPSSDDPSRSTEQAIRADPNLTDEEREALIAVYRSYRQRDRPA